MNKEAKNKMNIVFAINDEYVNHLNIAIYSLLKNNQKSFCNITVLCDRLSSFSKNSINKIIEHFNNVEINFVELHDQNTRFQNLKLNIEHISKETYYRYIIPEILKNEEVALYLDADILVSGDISDMYIAGVDDMYIAGVDDMYIAGVDESDNPKRFPGYKESIGFKNDELYVNAGVLLMNLKKIREDNKITELFNNTIRFADKIRFQDQDIINITFQGKMMQISNVYNYTDQDKVDGSASFEDIRIVHYNGISKPWRNQVFADFQVPFVELYSKYENEYNELIYGNKNKYALYRYTTENIGDEIQSLAARQFLPRVDYFINRDFVGEWSNSKQSENVKLITNAWYSHPPFSWPIKDKTLDPLYTSIYVEQLFPEVVEKWTSKEAKQNYSTSPYEKGKVGARDKQTLQFFQDNNIESYLSGCMTLTLQKDSRIKKGDFILLTDTSKALYEYVKSKTDRPVIYLSNAIVTTTTTTTTRFRLAEMFLYLYQSAHCVITERLHTALPCLALETPVLFIKKHAPIGGNINRLSGLAELTHYYTEEEFYNGGVFDVNNPPANPTEYLEFRNAHIKRTEDFTGYKATSFSRTDIPQMQLAEVIAAIEYIKATNLKELTIEALQVGFRNDNLQNALLEKNAKIAALESELNTHLSIKRSARLLAGNIKRRITLSRSAKRERESNPPTVIANNCIGGYLYKDFLKAQYNSPTMWMWFYADDFIKFATNLEDFCLNGELTQNERLTKEKGHPVGELSCSSGKVTLYMNHYESFEVAKEKWFERVKRINWDNINVVMSYSSQGAMNALTKKISRQTLVDEFGKIPYKKVWITDFKTKNTYVLENAFEANPAGVWNNGTFPRENGKWSFLDYDFEKMFRKRGR